MQGKQSVADSTPGFPKRELRHVSQSLPLFRDFKGIKPPIQGRNKAVVMNADTRICCTCCGKQKHEQASTRFWEATPVRNNTMSSIPGFCCQQGATLTAGWRQVPLWKSVVWIDQPINIVGSGLITSWYFAMTSR